RPQLEPAVVEHEVRATLLPRERPADPDRVQVDQVEPWDAAWREFDQQVAGGRVGVGDPGGVHLRPELAEGPGELPADGPVLVRGKGRQHPFDELDERDRPLAVAGDEEALAGPRRVRAAPGERDDGRDAAVA